MSKKAKKVSFSSQREEYKAGPNSTSELVTVNDEDPEQNTASESESSTDNRESVDLWEEDPYAYPSRIVTDTPKPKIFTPLPSLYSIPVHLVGILYAMFTVYDIQTNVELAMLMGGIVLAVCQFAYNIALEVNANKSRRRMPKPLKKRAVVRPKKKRHTLHNFNGGDLLNLCFAFVLSVCAAAPVHAVLVLFGAPIGSSTLRTFYLALHLSLLTVFPLLSSYRLSDTDFKACWTSLLTFQVGDFYKNQVYTMVIGALVGCWLGVIPIPLDWDRPWQAWPITLLAGAYVGAVVGNVAGYLAAKLL